MPYFSHLWVSDDLGLSNSQTQSNLKEKLSQSHSACWKAQEDEKSVHGSSGAQNEMLMGWDAKE